MNDNVMMNTVPFFLDDISSIESSSRRERKFSEEQLAEQANVIQTLTYAVQKLANTLESKEAELETNKAELKMTHRVEVDLESKVLDLMIENAELKNQATDQNEEVVFQDPPSIYRPKEQRTPATTDDFSSFQREAILRVVHFNDKENNDNVAETVESLFKSDKPRLIRRSSGPTLSKLVTSKLPNLKSGLGGRSLFTNIEGKRISWAKGGGYLPKVIPRRIKFDDSILDELSDISSV